MDTVDPATRSRIMSRIRSKGNSTTELPLASAMRRMGVSGWRRHIRIVTPSGHIRPDFVFPRERLAILVHGCFWHSCPIHGTLPKSNRAFWENKLKANKRRDRKRTRELKGMGWDVLAIWEHEVRKSAEACAEKILWRLHERQLCAGANSA
jgi:DNA mismatch endonuclease, patch repair protein